MIKRVLAALVLWSAPLSVEAQQKTGTIVVAHGGDSLWNSLVIDAAKSARTGGPVEVSFLMGPGAKAAPFQNVVARLEKAGVSEIVVVPLLVSSYSGHYDQIRYLVGDSVTLDERMQHHLHMAGIERPRTSLPLRLTSAMDDAPEIARVLAERAVWLASDARERAVLIVGHGPNSAEDYARWMKNLRVVADSAKARGAFSDVRVELVRDDAPAHVRAEAVKRTRELIELQHKLMGKEVLVVPVLVSKGVVSRDKLPRDLAGLPILYSGEPLLPHAEVVRWIERRVSETAATTTQLQKNEATKERSYKETRPH